MTVTVTVTSYDVVVFATLKLGVCTSHQILIDCERVVPAVMTMPVNVQSCGPQAAINKEDSSLIAEDPGRSPVSRDGYGFRKSGMSPASTHDAPHHSQLSQELVPDPNGLGWPGVFPSLISKQ